MYTFVDDEGRKRFEIERLLAQIEGDGASNIPKLISDCSMSDDQRAKLAIFFGLLAVRTPEFIESTRRLNGELIKRISQVMISTEDQALAAIDANEAFSDRALCERKELARGLLEFTQAGEYEVESDRQEALAMALRMADDLGRIFFDRHWLVWEAPRGASFVTGDSPVVLTPLRARNDRWPAIGYGSSNALTIFPISSTRALAMFDRGCSLDRIKVDRVTVRQFNVDLARRAKRFLIGRDDRLVLSVSRLARMEYEKWRPRFSIS